MTFINLLLSLQINQPVKNFYKFGKFFKLKEKIDNEVKFLQKSKTGVSFFCELPSGKKTKIKCGMSDYKNPPLSGDILTVVHFGFSLKGNLKFPYFLKIRFDITWDQVLENQ